MTSVQVSVGDRGEVVAVVTADDTALALGSGAIAVLGTPRLVAWCEAATCRAVVGGLPEGSTTVGTSVRLDHLVASTVGERVLVRAVLTRVDCRRLGFDVEASDTSGRVVGRGVVERIVVDEHRFLDRTRRG